MPLVPLQLPPGVYRNGTDLQSAGRWRDASLVRWTDGTMQPVGGWLTRVTVTDQPLRGALAWRDLDGDRWFATGSHLGLFVGSAANTITNITPGSFVGGTKDAAVNLGYGGGFYGTGAYGIARPDTGTYSPVSTWSLDTWGEYLVACNPYDGRLLEWQLNTANDAVAITNAPTGCDGLMVTEERFLFAFGPGGNFRRVQWSDREDNTTWTPLVTNEAGDIELQTAGQIMLGIRTRGQALILTDQDAHTASYQGPPFVYGFERVGSSCGAVSRLCAASVDAGVFWMGPGDFHVYSGGAVTEVPCEVADYVFEDINRTQISKVAAVANARYNEIWWFYPSGGSLENDRYVTYNYKEGHWSTGSLARTSGVDVGIFSTPIWMTPAGVAVNHEIGNQTDGAEAFAESGPVQIATGDNVMSALMLIPDEKTQGQVTTTFRARFHPNDTERTYGPYSMANPTDLRFTGRQVSMRVIGEQNTDWRWGVPRIDVRQGGLR
jgi:hypothetical protein